MSSPADIPHDCRSYRWEPQSQVLVVRGTEIDSSDLRNAYELLKIVIQRPPGHSMYAFYAREELSDARIRNESPTKESMTGLLRLEDFKTGDPSASTFGRYVDVQLFKAIKNGGIKRTASAVTQATSPYGDGLYQEISDRVKWLQGAAKVSRTGDFVGDILSDYLGIQDPAIEMPAESEIVPAEVLRDLLVFDLYRNHRHTDLYVELIGDAPESSKDKRSKLASLIRTVEQDSGSPSNNVQMVIEALER